MDFTWSFLKTIKAGKLLSSPKKFACLLLNISERSQKHFERHSQLWYNADLRIAVDGSANYLAKNRLIHTVDIICGDFDSIDHKIIENIRSPNKATWEMFPKNFNVSSNVKLPQIIETPDQKYTDFTKAIWVALNNNVHLKPLVGLYHGDGSRNDHIFGLINSLHLVKKQILLLNIKSNTLSWLLRPGFHQIETPRGKHLCSLIPFNGPTKVTTQGLEYNVKPTHPLSFSGIISTSNVSKEDCDMITVETDRELLWSIDI